MGHYNEVGLDDVNEDDCTLSWSVRCELERLVSCSRGPAKLSLLSLSTLLRRRAFGARSRDEWRVSRHLAKLFDLSRRPCLRYCYCSSSSITPHAFRLCVAFNAECTACSCAPSKAISLHPLAPHTTTHLGDQMTALLNQPHQPPHIRAPLVQHLVVTPRRLEADNSRRTVNLGVHRLGRNEGRKELLRLGGREVEQLCETGERDARVVL